MLSGEEIRKSESYWYEIVREDFIDKKIFDCMLTLYGRMLLFGNIVSLKPLYIFENGHEKIVKYSIIKITYFSTNLYTLTIKKCFSS